MKAKTIAPMAMILALVMAALPAAAAHESNGDDARLEKVARKLGVATDALYCDLASSDARHSWEGWKALRAVRRLDRRAQAFNRHVNSRGFDRYAQHELRDLERAFARAERRLGALRIGHDVRKDFRRVAKLMDKLETRVARYDAPERRRRGEHRRERVAFAW